MNIEKIETFKYYESFNGSYGVKLPDQELEYIHSLCMNSYPYETGGILIGRYSDDLKWAEITTITGAPAESKQTLCSFVRSTRGIITKLKRAWQKQQYYLGEWHYHPNASPKPSALDLKTMVNLSKDEDLGCPEPILLVIGGSSSNWLQYIGVYVKEQEIELYEINNLKKWISKMLLRMQSRNMQESAGLFFILIRKCLSASALIPRSPYIKRISKHTAKALASLLNGGGQAISSRYFWHYPQ